MALNIVVDADSLPCSGLFDMTYRHIKEVDVTIGHSNPYVVGGNVLTVAALKAALDAAYGCSLPTLVIDSVDFHGPSINGLVRNGWIAATGAIMAYDMGTAAALTAGAASALTAGAASALAGGVATVLALTVHDLTGADIVGHVATIPAPAPDMIGCVCLQNAGGYIRPCILPAGIAPANAGDCAYNQAARTITCLAADAITHVHVHALRVTAGTDAVLTPNVLQVLTPNVLQVLTPNVLPAEYGAVDISAAANIARATVRFHFA